MTTPEPNGNGSPGSVFLAILKRDGVLGLFLCALCWFIWTDNKADRLDRERTAALQKEMFDSLTTSHRREATITIQAVEALRTTSAAVDNTRKALLYVERFHHRAEREN